MMMLLHKRTLLMPLVLLVAWNIGCTDSGSRKKTKSYDGVANSINLQTKEVSITVVREDGSEHELKGTVRDDTEVWINGRQQALKDVNKGDKVRAWVVKDKSDGKYIVIKVEVDRPLSYKKPADDGGVTSGESDSPPSVSLASSTETKPVPEPVVVSDPLPEIVDREPVPSRGSAIGSREDAEDMIYGQIRLRMEIAIEKRRELLSSGAGRIDPEVQAFETQITKARVYLIENGEIVGEVEPPL
ncbi:MAG: hypothetical protein O7F76_07745 [Planctomycetota bacterium]|nr:hypothetical protein [Planctomycetota bacterium]